MNRGILMLGVLMGSMVLMGCPSPSASNGKTEVRVENGEEKRQEGPVAKMVADVASPQAVGAEVGFVLEVMDAAVRVDSVQWRVDNGETVVKGVGEKFVWQSAGAACGIHRVQANMFLEGGQKHLISMQYKLFSGIVPKIYTPKILHTYPHSTEAYTQGLLFFEGHLYESTGLHGKSQLRKCEPVSGKAIQEHSLKDEYFGEGLALVNDTLIQITWENRKAIFYNRADFKQIKEIDYSFNEGWGLAYDGERLIMSDGSEKLYFLKPQTFELLGQVSVADNEGFIKQINELEYIDGYIWANVYYTDTILIIDPKSGAVVAKLDCSGLLAPSDISYDTNVLNGIAYDKATGRVFITGKNWPKLFVIEKVK